MNYFRKLIGWILFIGFFAISFFAVSNAQALIDWWKLRDYVPDQTIVALADATSMTDRGRHLFYVYDPVLLDKENFQDRCTVGESTIVLGCYISNDRIYLYDVSDERLEGIEEVTAAHEMLHAAYDRLSLSERERIDRLTQEAFERITDERIRENVRSYEQRDPSIVPNELHSILGTEVKDLPNELELYYAEYFIDRQVVVEFAASYSDEFQKRENQIKIYDTQLTELNGQITRLQAELNVQNNQLQQDRATLEAIAQEGNPSVYNQRVNSYNIKVENYNRGVRQVKEIIDKYNAVVIERNNIAVEERELVEAIDTRDTIQQQ